MKVTIHWWAFARRLTALAFAILLVLGGRHGVEFLVGTTAGTKLAGTVPFVDPASALEVLVTSEHGARDLFLGAGLLTLLAVLLGPVFCGWLCPLGLLTEWTSLARRRVLRLFGRKPRPHPGPATGHSRRFVLVFVLAASWVAGVPLLIAFSPLHGLGRALAFGLDAGLFLVLAVLAIDLVRPRTFCRDLCPHGALLGLLGRRAPFRVRIDPARAGRIRCQRCDVACPMGIRVMEEFALAGKNRIDHPDCIRCGACTESCPRGVLSLGFGSLRSRGPWEPPPIGCSHGHCEHAVPSESPAPSEPAA